MAPREDMLDSLDSLKMLASDGAFANKEWGRGGKKVAPEPQPNAAQQALQTREDNLRAREKVCNDLSLELQAQDKRQTKRDHDLFLREQRLEKYKTDIDTDLETRKDLLDAEERGIQGAQRSLNASAREITIRMEQLKSREDAIKDYKDKKGELQSTIDKLTKQLAQEQNSLEKEKDKVKQEQQKREDSTNMANHLIESAKDNALKGLKLFVRMWKDEILTMIQQDKLRCIIPHDTTTWFKYNYYKLDSVRLEDLTYWLSATLDANIRDLRIDIDIQRPRFVIFYRQSKLEKYAAESWNGNLQNALDNMHCIQDDDRDQVDENLRQIEIERERERERELTAHTNTD